jgi:hypothetical protein
MGNLGLPFQLTEVDGVPCFWADAPGPCQAGLLFRSGRADERLAAGGITQLVERLALAEVGHRRGDYWGHHTTTITGFYGTGEPSEIAAVLGHVCRALHDLPDERFASERRVLGIEAARDEPTIKEGMLMMRFGASGFGLPFYEPFGLRWLALEHVAAWTREHYTSGNAALWMTCPPPLDLRLPLPPGARAAPPSTGPIPGLELPAFAAYGEGSVVSTIVAERSTALAVASSVVADRAHDLGYTADPWQYPLTRDLAHRYLVVDCDEHDADEVVADVLRIFDSVAEHGATPSELAEARANTLRALADDEAAPGALERMAVDELLGAPRRWKEDLAAAAESPSYAEVAAALRSALATQIVLAPVHTTKPAGRELADFPWFSRERIAGRELRAARGQRRPGEPDARLVVSQEGVSHVGDGAGHASTVKFADVAAALQEPGGALTLVGRDGAVVPLDPAYFKGAADLVADLEQRLPRDVVVPPRDASAIELIARRALRPRWSVDPHLRLLREQLGPEEELVTMCEAVLGVKYGVLALTDRRALWVFHADRAPVVRELPYDHVIDVKLAGFPSTVVTLKSAAGETAFSQIHPKERAREIVDEIQRRRQLST